MQAWFGVLRDGTLRTQKSKSPSAENAELSKVLAFKSEVGQNITLHASPTAKKSAFSASVLFIYGLIQLHFFESSSYLV